MQAQLHSENFVLLKAIITTIHMKIIPCKISRTDHPDGLSLHYAQSR